MDKYNAAYTSELHICHGRSSAVNASAVCVSYEFCWTNGAKTQATSADAEVVWSAKSG